MNRTVDIPEELAQFFLNLQPCTRMVDVHANMEKLCQILVEQRQGEPVAWTTPRELEILKSGNVASVYPNNVLTKIPVFLHADTGEVERLRAVVSRCRNRVSKVIIAKLKLRLERDALRAKLAELEALHGGELGLPKEGWPEYHKRKMETLRNLTAGYYERKLAERDALLRDVQRGMREYEQGCDQFPPFHHNQLMERIDTALSASAEPSAPKCKSCGQVPEGQSGEYPCKACGLPTVHDEPSAPTCPHHRAGECWAKPGEPPCHGCEK